MIARLTRWLEGRSGNAPMPYTASVSPHCGAASPSPFAGLWPDRPGSPTRRPRRRSACPSPRAPNTSRAGSSTSTSSSAPDRGSSGSMAARGVGPHERGLSRMVSRHHSPGVIRRIKMCAIVALAAVFLRSGSPRPTGSGAGLRRSLTDRGAGPAAVTATTEISPRDWGQIMAKGDAPVLEVLADINP